VRYESVSHRAWRLLLVPTTISEII
jgi:hypothetical protein